MEQLNFVPIWGITTNKDGTYVNIPDKQTPFSLIVIGKDEVREVFLGNPPQVTLKNHKEVTGIAFRSLKPGDNVEYADNVEPTLEFYPKGSEGTIVTLDGRPIDLSTCQVGFQGHDIDGQQLYQICRFEKTNFEVIFSVVNLVALLILFRLAFHIYVEPMLGFGKPK